MAQEHSTPQKIEWAESANLTDILEKQRKEHPNRVLYRLRRDTGWEPLTAEQFHERVTQLAKGLIAWGVEPGDRIGIMSRTRFEWSLIDFAIWYAGGVSVPIYETSSAHQVHHIVTDSGLRAVFVETEKLAVLVNEATSSIGGKLTTWVIENDAIGTLNTLGQPVDDGALENARTSRDSCNLATIVYTSGTTGEPKGCMLTHGNFLNLSSNAKLAMGEIANPSNSTILFLPLAHVLARTVQILALDSGMTVGHAPDIKNLTTDLQEFKPTMLLVVPRVLEKVFEGAALKASKGGRRNENIFNNAVKAAQSWSERKIRGRITWGPYLQHKLYDLLVYSKLRRALGGNLKYAVSGGGPLNPNLAHFYHAIGVKVLEGYGLTETSAPITVGLPDKFSVGNVGYLLPGSSGRIAADGELEVKGPGVFPGYYQHPNDTKDAFTSDGWFKTGDLAEFTGDGALRIIGRKKEIIVTAGGKNVIPAKAENMLKSSPGISQAVLVGDNKPFVSALVTLDPDSLPDQLEHIGLPKTMSLQDASVHPKIREYVQKAVDEVNSFVSKAESIREFRVLPTDFTEKAGHLTPSMKVKRVKVLEDFSVYVEDMYSRGRKTLSEKTHDAKAAVADRLHSVADSISPSKE